MKKHQKTHAEIRIKSFKCDFEGCDSAFTAIGHLKRHKCIHTGEKKYPCDFEDCESKFASSGELNMHKRVHTGIRAYKCNFDGCNFTASRLGNLTTHKKGHIEERPFKCDVEYCDYANAHARNLKNHKLYWHTQEGQVRKKKDEARILRLLEKHNFDFKSQHCIDFVCVGSDRDGSRCFIDFLIEIKNKENQTIGFVFLEVDEHQHSWYSVSCEIRRMADVQRTLILEGNTFPVLFLRYNPHKYTVDSNPKKLRVKDREAQLVDYLKNVQFDNDFSVVYMFYNTVDEEPYIFTDPEYADSFKNLVIDCVV